MAFDFNGRNSYGSERPYSDTSAGAAYSGSSGAAPTGFTNYPKRFQPDSTPYQNGSYTYSPSGSGYKPRKRFGRRPVSAGYRRRYIPWDIIIKLAIIITVLTLCWIFREVILAVLAHFLAWVLMLAVMAAIIRWIFRPRWRRW